MTILTEIKKYKKGVLVGIGVGAVAACYLRSKGTDLLFAVESQGLLDRTALASDPATLAFYKVALVFMVVGAFVGYLIEKKLMK